jgi:hypothetical protein
MEVKPYLEYLDKEMTIMGILSAASVAAPAGILNAALSKDAQALLWNPEHFFIVMGSVLCVIAAMLFYKERSDLAWYYGQICLTEAIAEKKALGAELREWLRDADSWETWWPYCLGFTSLAAGIAEYLFAFFFLLAPSHWPWLATHLSTLKTLAFLACPILACVVAPVQWYVRTRYKFSDDAWTDFKSDLLKRLQSGRRLPHEEVYTRLIPSRIHGVGVAAIKDIPQGTYVFEPDDDALVSIRAKATKSLPPEVRQLYEDFCVLKGDKYECPSSFNKLNPAWFLNNSKDPNMAADSSLKFYAIRDIKAGEELTADYETYSKGQSNGNGAVI